MSSTGLALLVGTTKGAFLISGGSDRSGWTVKGPFCDGWPINHMVGDPQTGQLWAGGGGDWSGAAIWNSDDHGETWNRVRLTKGSMDDWAANDAEFAAMIDWSDEPLPFA
ncbi:MAG: exo-alpha-sialidase, partial [Roseibium sp.]